MQSTTSILRVVSPFVAAVAAVACARGEPNATCSAMPRDGADSMLAWDEPAAGVSIRGTLSFEGAKGRLAFVKCPEGYPADRLALMSARGAKAPRRCARSR